MTNEFKNNFLLTSKDVSEILGVTEHTLAVWRCENRYPLKYVKIGRFVRYREDDILKFIEDQAQ